VRGTRIVEFISDGMEMTDARMAVVGEKLLNADLNNEKRSILSDAPFSIR